ncbi:hypothetical protein FVE67_01090 [Thermosulfurimonas marina]|uniref:Outer membrane protein assembly factor BamE n=1 Tax=Thermosulfurimonas marina TaxID=2047767 RepID=A0A6H1WQN6_9BACT|nr:hypothetical protein [Thermosulfurimonas marina]QJA05470.1 hypothetical protein FVE67_01090 [Thermosulfurimonas marina]
MRRLLLIGLLMGMVACTPKPGVNLASKACMVKKQVSAEEVRRYLGPPQRVERLPDGRVVWFYYNLQKDALAAVPFLGEKFGRQEIEVLRITFSAGRVVDCLYYVTEPRS